MFIRTPSDAYRAANSFVWEARPARNTADVGKSGSGSNTAKVEMFTIDPPPCSTIVGVTCRAIRATLSRYTSMPVCHSSSLISSRSPFGP